MILGGSIPSLLTNFIIMKGSTNTKPFKLFQIRWAEKLGVPDDPYLVRWTFILFGYSMRIHHWIKSDDDRYFHDHSADLLSIVLKGRYWNVKPIDDTKNPNTFVCVWKDGAPHWVENRMRCYVEGIFNSWHNFFNTDRSIWFSKAEDLHYLRIPKGGAWTLMFEGRPKQKWGFIVNGHKWRPLRYFHKFGIRQIENYQ